ncbi:hypothetical protein E3T54_02955 [Cryobacterium sp. Sr8]|uniref:hypothetical protein n=1 Tax=Cryobacterium sp. Sr8 TaxID=1259203 RepID=UPI0010693082|nr:hypothetical protein [Cryobacterium sp. Sr8]TFD80716.1 hypothetical protein E3T54_02955 [Cryobacterium sp. Sr8]
MAISADQIYVSLGAITFGDVDEFGVDWALESFDGWGATGSTLSVTQKPRGNGGWAGGAYAQPRTLAIAGKFYAPNAGAARAALDRLNAACSLSETTLTVFEPGLARTVAVRRSDDVIHDWITPTYCSWSVQVIAPDPRKLSATLTASTGLPSTSGGLTVPFTVPFSITAATVSGQVNLTNTGNTSGPVLLRIDGPCVGPMVTHVGSGLSMVFASSLVLNAGEWLDIDMEARQVLANGQSSRSGYVTSRGWSSFTSGPNTWAFTAASFSAGALLTVIATPADQ